MFILVSWLSILVPNFARMLAGVFRVFFCWSIRGWLLSSRHPVAIPVLSWHLFAIFSGYIALHFSILSGRALPS